METDIQDLETENSLQDDRLNIIDEAVNDNDNEIDGNTVKLCTRQVIECCVFLVSFVYDYETQNLVHR